jgi:nucleoside-diphosphate-sugar epimerase
MNPPVQPSNSTVQTVAYESALPTVVITGVSGALGRRVVAHLAEKGEWRVVGIDTQPFPAGVAKPRYFTVHRVDMATTDLARLVKGATVLVHLAAGDPEAPTAVEDEIRLVRKALRAADSTAITNVVVLSSAAVFGAWVDNPVPLTESAPLRPFPGFRYADQKRALETEVTTWLTDHPGSRAAILRPAPTLGHPDSKAWLAKATKPPIAKRIAHEIAPQQYVHVEDLAEAICVAFVAVVNGRVSGVLNVAADGWLTPEDAQELFGPGARFPTDGPLGQRGLAMISSVLDNRRPEGVAPYLAYPWVVSNDRMRSLGWVPRSTNAEALVASQRPWPGSRFVAKHRQEVTLALVGILGLSAAGVASTFIRRWLRRRLR